MVLASFTSAEGTYPHGTLTVGGSTLYGMCEDGGANGDGTVFSVPVSGGTISTLYSFGMGTADGISGGEGLTLSGGKLYGTTLAGGTYGHDGTVFSINTGGGGYTQMGDFNGTDGATPIGSLVLSGSTLYGMTEGGGSYQDGTVFSLPVTGGTPTTLLVFSGTNGAGPQGSLTLSGSTLFGTTNFGGKYDGGNIFSINTNGGGYADLYDFSFGSAAAYGAGPQGTLAARGSALYGTTSGGGIRMGHRFRPESRALYVEHAPAAGVGTGPATGRWQSFPTAQGGRRFWALRQAHRLR